MPKERRSCCDLSNNLHGSGTADSDGPRTYEQSKRWWQMMQSNTASYVQDAETRNTLQQPALSSTRRAENVEKSVIWPARVDPSGTAQPKAKARSKKGKGGKRASTVKTRWNCGETWADVFPVSQGEGPSVGRFDHSKPSRQPGHHHGRCNWKLLGPWQRE